MQDAHVETTNTTAEQHLETRKVVRLEAANARQARTGGESGRRRTHTCGDTRRWWWRPGEACGRVGTSCTRPAAPASPSPPGAARPPPPPPSLAPTTLSRPSRGHRAPHFHAWSPRRGPSSGTASYGSSRRIDPRITRRRGKRPGSEHREQPRLNFYGRNGRSRRKGEGFDSGFEEEGWGIEGRRRREREREREAKEGKRK